MLFVLSCCVINNVEFFFSTVACSSTYSVFFSVKFCGGFYSPFVFRIFVLFSLAVSFLWALLEFCAAQVNLCFFVCFIQIFFGKNDEEHKRFAIYLLLLAASSALITVRVFMSPSFIDVVVFQPSSCKTLLQSPYSCSISSDLFCVSSRTASTFTSHTSPTFSKKRINFYKHNPLM
jgi:hypothetical protein